MNFLIYGDDNRHAILSNLFIEAGFNLRTPADLLILSPKESISAHNDEINKDCLIWGGSSSDAGSLQSSGYRKIKQRDSFRMRNSIYTAEGALSLAITTTKVAICESIVFVLGYGFLGKECARLFSALGATVTVYTEEQTELRDAAQAGFSTKSISELSVLNHAILINTIPYPVLDPLPLICKESTALLIELASTTCLTKTVDGLQILPAGALPSRFSPESAAKLMFEEILYHLKKE